ncbi:OsmC family protein [Paenibacillus puerhi]|uniref:OsmC family protein n=1 Tax=Paenibacillus puerhi TaxID=2692622 RepID=UPI001357A543|nr:OsmC family protein [Paenibacillus puerhi]
MSDLNGYLKEKRAAVLRREEERIQRTDRAESAVLTARVRAKGRTGVREIRIRDFQIISDSDPDFAGFNLGPNSAEIQLGVLGSCLTHVTLIQAASLGVPLNALEVEINGELHPYAGKPGYEHVPFWPHHIRYTLHIDSPAEAGRIEELYEAVERVCPILNLLANPQQITGHIVHTTASGGSVLAT